MDYSLLSEGRHREAPTSKNTRQDRYFDGWDLFAVLFLGRKILLASDIILHLLVFSVYSSDALMHPS